MGLFDKIFKSEREVVKKEIVAVPWHPLEHMEQLSEIEQKSHQLPVVIFKHSTRCGISRMVLGNLEKDFDLPKDGDYQLYFLDLLKNREISAEIQSRFGVVHESPQLLVIRNGKCIYHRSHHGIDFQELKQNL